LLTFFPPSAQIAADQPGATHRLRRRDAARLGVLGVSIALLASIGVAATASALTPNRVRSFVLPVSPFASAITPTRVVSLLGLLGVVLLLIPGRRGGKALLAVFACALAIAISGISVDAWFAPPMTWGEQWQAQYAPSYNLTYGLQLAANLREGHGDRYDNGSIDTYRMPGYPALVALAGTIARVPERDLRGVAAATIWFQLLLTAAAIGLFAYVAASRFHRLALLLIIVALVSLPANVQFTQDDSVIFAVGLLVTSAMLPFLDRARGDGARWRDVLLLHLSFAFYFIIRTDVAVAWVVVSLIVHGRRWRHLVVGLALFILIGAGYGAYAKANGNEFSFGTNNAGHVAFVGLWELPQDRFIWMPKDESYNQWISAHGYTYKGPGTNVFAEKEVLRFYVTFPGYVVTMAVNKALNYFDLTSVDPYTYPPFVIVQRIRAAIIDGGAWLFLCAILFALLVGYRRYETAMLSWAALFVLPIFFFVQDESRFTLFTIASLSIAAIPLLLDVRFYQALYVRRRLVAPLAVVLLILWTAHTTIGYDLLNWNSFRYWTPLLNPHDSTLAVYRQ